MLVFVGNCFVVLRQGGYVFIGVLLFVCLFVSRIVQKTTRSVCTEFGGEVAYGPRKKPLDVVGNPDLVKLSVGLGLGLLLCGAV